jgi:hypothetical protein
VLGLPTRSGAQMTLSPAMAEASDGGCEAPVGEITALPASKHLDDAPSTMEHHDQSHDASSTTIFWYAGAKNSPSILKPVSPPGNEIRSISLTTSQLSQLDSDISTISCHEECFYCPDCSEDSACESCLECESCIDCLECEECDEMENLTPFDSSMAGFRPLPDHNYAFWGSNMDASLAMDGQNAQEPNFGDFLVDDDAPNASVEYFSATGEAQPATTGSFHGSNPPTTVTYEETSANLTSADYPYYDPAQDLAGMGGQFAPNTGVYPEPTSFSAPGYPVLGDGGVPLSNQIPSGDFNNLSIEGWTSLSGQPMPATSMPLTNPANDFQAPVPSQAPGYVSVTTGLPYGSEESVVPPPMPNWDLNTNLFPPASSSVAATAYPQQLPGYVHQGAPSSNGYSEDVAPALSNPGPAQHQAEPAAAAPGGPPQKYCRHCGKPCPDSSSLNKHEKTHEEAKMNCWYCREAGVDKNFKRADQLKRHVRKRNGRVSCAALRAKDAAGDVAWVDAGDLVADGRYEIPADFKSTLKGIHGGRFGQNGRGKRANAFYPGSSANS